MCLCKMFLNVDMAQPDSVAVFVSSLHTHELESLRIMAHAIFFFEGRECLSSPLATDKL